eukprot:scaffold63488_cov51-Attheya_sp.AAC.4
MWMSTAALRGSPRTPNKVARPSPPSYHLAVVPTNDEPDEHDTDENDDSSWCTMTSNHGKDGGETKHNNNELHNTTVESSKSEAPSASLKEADRNPDPSTGMHRSYGVRLRRSRSGIGRPTPAAPTTATTAASVTTTTTPSRVRTRIRPRRFVRMDRPPVRPRTSHVLVSTLPTEEDRQEQSAASTVRMKDIWTSRGIGIPQNTHTNTNTPSSPAAPTSATHSSHGHSPHGHHSRKHSHGRASKSVTHTTTSAHDTSRKKENQVNYSDAKWRSLLEQERATNALLQSRIDGLTQLANLYQAQLLACSAPQEEEHQQQCPVHHPSNNLNLKCTCTPTDHETNTNNTHHDNIFI